MILGGMPIRKAPSNERRLSCGAELECSQTELYHSDAWTSPGLLRTGADSFKRVLGSGRILTTLHQWIEPLIGCAPSDRRDQVSARGKRKHGDWCGLHLVPEHLSACGI